MMTARTLELEGGKYRLTLHDDGRVVAQRYSEDWPVAAEQFIGNKMLHLLLERALDAEASLVELAPAKRIEVGDRVEHLFADVDPRTVIAVGPDWLWLDFQQAQLAAGELPTFLPMRNYRRIG